MDIRFAGRRNALGHNSKAVHLGYAKGVIAICPPLEDYENSRGVIAGQATETELAATAEQAPRGTDH